MTNTNPAPAALDFPAWLIAQGLPTHLPAAGSAASDPARFAAFLLRSPDSLTRTQRGVLAGIVRGA